MAGVGAIGALRARSYVLRLPLFTRTIAVIIGIFWILGIPSLWNVRHWAALIPDKVSFASAYRLSTYPLVHLNFLHAILNVAALTPLIERFENEHGTLTTFALFFGPLTTLPAIIYLIVERGILRGNTSIMGASVWVFLLLGMEAIRTYRSNPHLVIGTYHIPTWTSPLLMVVVVAALIPNTSMLGHLCGVGVGYLAGLGCIKFLSPPERVLRWVETRLNLLAVLPHYVSVDQKTYGRFGVLPLSSRTGGSAAADLVAGSQRLGT